MKRNRILYGCLFFLSLVFIYFYGGKVPYMLFNIMVILPVVSFGYMLYTYIRFKFAQDVDKKFVMKGDKIHFLFSINNEDFLLYPYIKVNFCGAETVFANQFQAKNFSLTPQKSKTFSFELECKYRGRYAIGIKSIEFEDFLGIFKLSYNINETKEVAVHPRIVYLDRFNLKSNYISESHSALNNNYRDMTTVSDIRKYAYGDNLKSIHWKLTARTNEIMVKNFHSTSQTSSILMLDLHKNKFSVEENTIIEDKIIECVVAVAYYCLSNWMPASLLYFKEGLVSVDAKNTLDFNEIYEVLSKISFKGTVKVSDLLHIYLENNVNKKNIIIFTSNVTYDLYNEIYMAKFSGFDIILLYISPEEVSGSKNEEAGRILSSLPEIGVMAYKVNINDNIKQILESC